MTRASIRSGGALADHAGRAVAIYGEYGVQRLGGHVLKVQDADGNWQRIKRVAFIRLSDDQVVQLENRPDHELDELAGQHVVAYGTLMMPVDRPEHPQMARPDAVPMLVEITAIQPSAAD